MSKKFIHLGCGSATKNETPFIKLDWEEVRVDIDPTVEPDVLGTMTDLGSFSTSTVDAVYSSHSIEHLYWYEVQPALKEILRVLKPTGFLLVRCPDIVAAAQIIVSKGADAVAYVSASGPITALDMLYGKNSFVQEHPFMAHKYGFSVHTLRKELYKAGFGTCRVASNVVAYELSAIATKKEVSMSALSNIVEMFR